MENPEFGMRFVVKINFEAQVKNNIQYNFTDGSQNAE